MGESIVITSGKGGVGKSTVAVALARLISDSGRSVVLMDMDMGMRSLDLMLGVQDNVVYDLADVCEGVCRIKQALVRVEQGKEFYLLNAAQTRGSEAITPHQVERVAQRILQRFDYLLLDCPAGVGRGFRNACAGADAAILVAAPDPIGLRDAERVVGLLQKCDIRDPLLLVNRVRPSERDSDQLEIEEMHRDLRLQLIGWLPELPPGEVRALHRRPEMRLIMRRLMGESIDVAPPKKPGFLARISRALTGRRHSAAERERHAKTR